MMDHVIGFRFILMSIVSSCVLHKEGFIKGFIDVAAVSGASEWHEYTCNFLMLGSTSWSL